MLSIIEDFRLRVARRELKHLEDDICKCSKRFTRGCGACDKWTSCFNELVLLRNVVYRLEHKE